MLGLNIKSILIIGLLLIIGVIYINTSSYDQKTDNPLEYEEYLEKVDYSKYHMPQLDSLNDYQNIMIYYKHDELISTIDTIVLKVVYDKEVFVEELENINNNYTFLSNTSNELEDIEADVNGYQIKVVKKDIGYSGEEYYLYPKAFLMIGVNYENNSIIYLFNSDTSLDVISDLDKHVNDYYLFE